MMMNSFSGKDESLKLMENFNVKSKPYSISP